ncbi:MAG: acyl-CoA-binding protein [Myxococcales bacterium]|nr:acyl-CoA-binding protein [Myxococcales bacterium]
MSREEFDQARSRLDASKRSVDVTTQLELYGLYKQATEGDVQGSRPGALNIKARAKWDAWATRKGMSASEAQQAYVDLANQILEG